MNNVMFRSIVMMTMFILATLMIGCAQTAAPAASIQEVTITGADYSFQAPDSINAGWTRIKFSNTGKEPHHAQLLRLNDGVTYDQFQEAMKKGEGPALALVSETGGAGAIDPSGADQVLLNLTAGNYLLICFIPSADGVPHLAKGMLKPLQVKATTTASASPPQTAATVRMKDFSFDMPDTLPAGRTAVQVVNDGPQGHEWTLMQLADGKTATDVFAWFAKPAGPPPFASAGGMNGLSTNLSGIAEFDFKPGRYLAVCNIPDPATGKSHAQLGMVKDFVVK